MSYGRSISALFALTTLAHGCAEESADPRYLDAGASRADAAAQGDGAAADAGTQDSADPVTAARDFAAFDEAVEAAIAAHNASAPAALRVRGVSTVVVDRDDGVVHTHGHGEFDADRLYLIASSSKILSVGVLMRLVDQGKLDIDAPISRYLPEAWGAHKESVTVAQLVSNSSGLPSLQEIAGSALSDPLSPRFAPHLCQYSDQGTLASCGRSIYEDDLPENNREPDRAFRYGGSQWQLAGAIAEQVSGKSWAALIDETYRQPCGVTTLGYTNQFAKSALSYPPDFDGDASRQPVTQNPSIEGGAYITGPDYGKLLHMHLRGGLCGEARVLSEDAVATMQENRIGEVYGGTTGNPLLPGYGLGWWVGADFVSDGGAYGAYPFIDNERGYAAMLLMEVNSEVGAKLAHQVKPTLDAIFE